MLFLLLLLLLVLLAVTFYLVAPQAGTKAQRAPFDGRNYAHRGLFTPDQKTPENSLPAFAAAVKAGYGVELDVQFSSDKKLLVFHDDTLDRMTGTKGWVRDFPYEQIIAMPLAGTAEHAPLLREVLETLGGRVPMILEIKSRSEYTAAYLDELCAATLEALKDYNGPYCIESFDPRVVQRIRRMAPDVLRGQLVDCYDAYRKEGTKPWNAYGISHCFCNFLGRPNFVAWCPARPNWAVRLNGRLGAMLVNWTALPENDQAALQKQYDAVIFQWYTPATHYSKD